MYEKRWERCEGAAWLDDAGTLCTPPTGAEMPCKLTIFATRLARRRGVLGEPGSWEVYASLTSWWIMVDIAVANAVEEMMVASCLLTF